MIKLPLERPKKVFHKEFPWTSCAPFVENSRGILIHRPRTGSTFNLHRTGPHVGLGYWCGMHTASDGKNLTFLSAPPEDKILCARCEAFAVANGLPSADELAGRHVHKGGGVAVATCCNALGEGRERGILREASSGEAATSTDGLGVAVPPAPTFGKGK